MYNPKEWISREHEYPPQAKKRLAKHKLLGEYRKYMKAFKEAKVKTSTAFYRTMNIPKFTKKRTDALEVMQNAIVGDTKMPERKKNTKKNDLTGITSEDCEWVANNIQNENVLAAQAPSFAAYGLLIKAMDEKTGMYKWVMDHLAPKTFVQESVDKWERDPARNLINIEEQILAETQADN